MTLPQWKATSWGLAAAGLLGVGIFVGSNNLRHIDAALVGYTFACLFAAFGLGYRYSMWLQRPPTRMYWRRGWQSFFRPSHLWGSLVLFVRQFVEVILLNRFIWRRNRSRGIAHLLIMWGCVIAAAITFPLVYGWVFFETVPGDLTRYRTFAFGIALFDFRHESFFGMLLFHGLVWSSFLVIAGVLLALYRRFQDHGAAALQSLQEDILPLFMLFAVSVTGLLLTVSYTWMRGHGYDFLALTHAITVIALLLWLPFGKFFHIFQRPAQLAIKFYRAAGKDGEQAACVRCQQPFATHMHIDDLITVEGELGYRYAMPGNPAGHYQRVCPACRRKMFALAHACLQPAAHDEGVPTHGR